MERADFAGFLPLDHSSHTSPRYANLRDYLRVLREHRWTILAITVVAGAIAYGMSIREDPVYESTASIGFQDESQQLALLGGSSNVRTPAAQTSQARAATIEVPPVIRRVQTTLDSDLSLAQLQGAIETSFNDETFLVDATVTWGDAQFSAKLANAFVDQAAGYTNAQTRQDISAAVDSTKRQLDGVGKGLADQAERAELTGQITRLRFLLSNARVAQVVRTAQVPGAPVSPRPVRNTLLGILLGLVIGIVTAFLRDSLDRRLRGSRETQDLLDLPLLGHVRKEALGSAVWLGGKDEDEKDLESFRILRQNLDFLAVDTPLKRVLVTSPMPQEGKSTVAASLAAAGALLGRRTLLVECDLRRPTLAERLEIEQSPGLTDYLAGQATPEEVLQTVTVNRLGPSPDSHNGDGPVGASGLPFACITAGSPSPQPAELLQSNRFREFLETVGRAYESVIIDTSPLLPVVDTLELIPQVDGVLLCVRSKQTTREQALAATEALDRFPERPTALVVTGLQKRDAEEYGYYSYGYSYASPTSEAAAANTKRSEVPAAQTS